MNRKNHTRPRRASVKQRKNSPTRLRTYSLVSFCILMLLSGFFFAAQQHFSSMDYGMKNSRLRKQVDDLEAEKRRLLIARETSLSPMEIKRAAKRTGLFDPSIDKQEIAQVVSTTKQKALPPAAAESRSMIVKTAAVTSVQTPIVASLTKKEKAKPTKPKVVAN